MEIPKNSSALEVRKSKDLNFKITIEKDESEHNDLQN